jgi:hypothetical protein
MRANSILPHRLHDGNVRPVSIYRLKPLHGFLVAYSIAKAGGILRDPRSWQPCSRGLAIPRTSGRAGR